MRKGSWLSRPIQVNQTPATNKFDVKVAYAKALPQILDQIRCSDINFYRDSLISEAVDAVKIK